RPAGQPPAGRRRSGLRSAGSRCTAITPGSGITSRVPSRRRLPPTAHRRTPLARPPRRSSPRPTRRWGGLMANVSPLLRKGAILPFDPSTGVPLGTIMLQYNPDTLTRSLKPQPVGEEPDRTEILRLKGPPIQTIKAEVEIDDTDQIRAAPPDPVAVSLGIQPQLSLLELLVYPSSAVLL